MNLEVEYRLEGFGVSVTRRCADPTRYEPVELEPLRAFFPAALFRMEGETLVAAMPEALEFTRKGKALEFMEDVSCYLHGLR